MRAVMREKFKGERMFVDLPKKHFRVVAADPAWNFKSNSVEKPGRNPRRHYECMELDEIAALPVRDHVADNSMCLLWMIGSMLVVGDHIPILRSWGFEPTAMFFDWMKLNPNSPPHFFTPKDFFMNTGFTTRKNAEYVVMGKRGRGIRENAGVSSLIVAPVGGHSEKPEEFYRRVEKYTRGPYLELFGRRQREGWTVRGNQQEKFAPRSKLMLDSA